VVGEEDVEGDDEHHQAEAGAQPEGPQRAQPLGRQPITGRLPCGFFLGVSLTFS
jgi:hypothetical protein